MAATIHTADCCELLPALDEASFDSCVTDPPYELGLMGKAWDRSGVAHRAETWRTVLRVLKPGGHLLAFGGSRTYHRLVCALEEAGFEIRDCIMWLYGSGYPKSKQLGDGLGTGIKPAHEPIVLARRPPVGSATHNHEAWGTGALRIDDCRIPGTDVCDAPCGRWPANVLLDEEAAALLDEQAGHHVSRFFYCPKPSPRERDTGLEGMPSVPTGLLKGLKGESSRANHHPSVKPVALMRYLCRLVTPVQGTVLDPFAGSGSTGVAAVEEGLSFVGFEREPQYAEIASRRIAHAAQAESQA